MRDVQVLKRELLELDVELKRFKEELLTTRAEELERIFRAPAGKPHLRSSGGEHKHER